MFPCFVPNAVCYRGTLERIHGVLAQAVYMDPSVKKAQEQARALGNREEFCGNREHQQLRVIFWDLDILQCLKCSDPF